METTNSKKKRSRSSRSPDGEDKRRGRPRVEKPDESAQDRRRTQIRMAQRAYRQRKESTLDELRKRVSDLTNTIELMNKTFLDCRDTLYASNLSQDDMFSLSEVATQFESFLKDARNPGDDANATPTQPIQRTSNSLKGADVLNEVSLEAQNVPAWIDQSTLAPVNKSKVSDWTDMGLGYTMYLPETEGAVWTNDLSASVEAQKPHSQGYGQFSGSSTVEMSDAELPGSLQLSFQPPPPMTYSFQETTFARRVHRSCIERVYHLLLDPSRRQTEFERIFKLSLLGRDRKKLTASLKVVLDRGPHEDLDFWQAPLIHVGGAGTHYPRRDPFGNLVPKKSAYHLGIVGPQTLALLDNASRDSLSADMTIEIAGFEGEWFDPYDVQGYLEEKGIFIDPSSSFAEAELVEWSPSNSSISSASNAGNSEPSSLPKSTPLTQGQLTRLSEANADLSQWNDFTDMELGAVGFSDSKMGSWMNFLQPGEGIKMPNDADTLNQMVDWDDYNLNALPNDVSNTILPVSNPATPPPRKKNIIIDVSKLVDVLTISGVCLGRSPGFRRRDVDRALALSSFDAF